MHPVHKGFALSALAGVFAVGSAAMASSVIPEPVAIPWKSGNAAFECQEATYTTGVPYTYSFKIDNWSSAIGGDYTATFGDGQTNTITISNNDGTYFNWTASNKVGVVIVKGGKAASIFEYENPASMDAGMVSPNNASGKPAAVSHATFCWNADSSAAPPAPTTVVDSDGDGIADNLDAFPFDPERVAQRFYPNGSDYGYLAFEDNWPRKGDFDMNDLVVAYRAIETLNTRNEITDLKLVYEITARGAANDNAFAVHLPGVARDAINPTLTTLRIRDQAPVALPPESGQTDAVFILTTSVNTLTRTGLKWPCGFFNTVNKCPRSEPVLLVADIHFQRPLSRAQLGAAPYNPFIYPNCYAGRGQEIHLVDHPPTAKADPSLFGTGDDRSNPAQGRYYRTADNLPWALDVPETWRHPAEWNDVTNAYPDFATWTSSSGVTATSWYVSTANQGLVFQP